MNIEPTPNVTERVYSTVDPAYLRTEPIRIWQFAAAPIELQAYSSNGGDEDWLAFVPKDEYDADALPFFAAPHFARYVQHAITEYGDHVFIGAHS
jgi:hypothetical protein